MLTKTNLIDFKELKPLILLAEASRCLCYVRKQEEWHDVNISTPSDIMDLVAVFQQYVRDLRC